jgi:hypothetical protein
MSRKKIFILGLVFLLIACIAFVSYYFLVLRAENSIQRLVASESNGKLIFKVGKVKFDLLDLTFEFHKPELRSADSTNTNSGYHVQADLISFRVQSLFSFLTKGHLIVDSVLVQSPLIEVIKYKEGPHRQFSLPNEMNTVYQSMEKVLKIMNLNYLHVGNAKFRVYDRTGITNKPLEISNLNLTIQGVSKEQRQGNDKFLFADRILLEVFNQNITTADGNHSISFKQLRLSTHSKTIKLDSCYVYGKSNDTSANEFSVFIDSVRISNLDFNLLANRSIIKLDSALCINPTVRLKLQLKEKPQKTALLSKVVIEKDSVNRLINSMLGNLDIGLLAVRNASVNIQSIKHGKPNVYNTEHSNFSIAGLVVNDTADMPLQVKEVIFDIRDYTGYSADSLYMVQFNNIIIRDNKIRLNDFRLLPTRKNREMAKRNIKMEVFELDNIDWPALLYEHRIVAGHASLIKPDVNMVLPEPDTKTGKKAKANPFQALEKIRDKIKIGYLFFEDGNVKIDVLEGPKVDISRCYVGINVERLLSAGNEFRLIDALDSLAFINGNFKNNGTGVMLTNGSFSKRNSTLKFGQIGLKNPNAGQTVSINNFKLSGLSLSSMDSMVMDEISWEKANISMQMKAANNPKPQNNSTAIGYKLNIHKISGGSTKLEVKNDRFEASTQLEKISTGEIVLKEGAKPVITGLYIDGQFVSLNQQENTKGNIGMFHIADKQLSKLNNVEVRLPINGETANIKIPTLSFSVDLQSTLNGNIKADFIELSKPVFSFSRQEGMRQDSTQKKDKKSVLPQIAIGRITISEPVLLNLPSAVQPKMQFNTGTSKLDLLGINTENGEIKVDGINLAVAQPQFFSDKFRLSPTGKEMINLKGSALIFKPADGKQKSKWSFDLNKLSLSGLQVNTLSNDSVKQAISLSSFNIENLHLDDSLLKTPGGFVDYNKTLSISNGTLKLENDKTKLAVYNLSFSNQKNNLLIDSLIFAPVLDRDSFMKTKVFQTTYIQVNTGLINVKDIDFGDLLNDTILHPKKVTVNGLHFRAYKDKRLPFQSGIEKPMLTNMLLNIKPKIQVDSVLLKSGRIDYEEFNDRTQQYGKVGFTKLKGAVAGVKTFDPKPPDSLRFNIYSRLLDTVDLRVKYKQSYSDSLSGFNLKLIVNSVNLTSLNPMLLPFASAELKSGNLDTIRMSVIGRKYVAFGVMKMYYDDLNAVVLNKGDSSNKTLVTKSISFFANRIVHTKNKRGTGMVYAERDREKGFVNYWVKIVIGGVFTNAGVRTNKKQERKYEKGLKIHEVPPIPDIPVDY